MTCFHTFILQSVFMSGPQSLPKPVLRTVRASASPFNSLYLFFLLRSSSSCLRPLPRLSVTCILPSTFSSLRLFRRQILCKIWPNQLAILLFIYSFIQSFICSEPYDRSTVSSEASSPHSGSSASSFNSLYLIFSLTSSSSCLRPLPRLTITHKIRTAPAACILKFYGEKKSHKPTARKPSDSGTDQSSAAQVRPPPPPTCFVVAKGDRDSSHSSAAQCSVFKWNKTPGHNNPNKMH